MSIKHRYRLISLLMILSMCVLTGFALYWLVSQYRQERYDLNERLIHEYLSSKDRVIDSLVYVKVISPAMTDSVEVAIQISSGDSVAAALSHSGQSNFDFTAREHISTEVDDEGNVKKETIIMSSAGDSGQFRSLSEQDVLLRSIKLIYHEAGGRAEGGVPVRITEQGRIVGPAALAHVLGRGGVGQ